MNYILTTFFIIIFLTTCHGQKSAEYPSKESKEYYGKKDNKEFKPADVSFIKNLHYDFLSLRKSEIKTNPYKEKVSLEEVESMRIKAEKLAKLIADTNQKALDSLFNLEIFNPKISEISKDQVLRSDSLGIKHIIFYKDHILEDIFEESYWIAISNDGGEKWKKYYTGLVENNYYHIKQKSYIPLFKNDSIIQVEAAIVRQMTEKTLPVGFPEYKLVEDSLIMEINLNKIISDLDGDGLSDLYEKKIFTNPSMRDTDGDGIEDSADCNPRYRNIQNKYTDLYKFLLEYGNDDTISYANYTFRLRPANMMMPRETYFIITDDTNLIHLTDTYHTYIFMTSEEYADYMKQNLISPNSIMVSPLFQVDDKPNYKVIDVHYDSWGSKYLIIQKENEWITEMIESYII